jgi:TRAP transporter TAXI family solute receptor
VPTTADGAVKTGGLRLDWRILMKTKPWLSARGKIVIVFWLCLCSCQAASSPSSLPHGAAITIATGTPEGTYHDIGRDIQRIAERADISVKLVQTNGSFDNINLLGSGKVDLAILQLDVLKFASEVMRAQTGFEVLSELKVALNLYYEEIHVIARDAAIRSVGQLDGKRVAVGPEKSGSALSAEVLLAAHGLSVQKFFEAPEHALRKLDRGELDALIFVGGAPVPAFEKLDKSFHFVEVPANPLLEQIYGKRKVDSGIYRWADATEAYAVPSVLMTAARADPEYAAAVQSLILAILAGKEQLDASGHPKWRSSFVRSVHPLFTYRPAAEAIEIFNALDSYGYKIIRK